MNGLKQFNRNGYEKVSALQAAVQLLAGRAKAMKSPPMAIPVANELALHYHLTLEVMRSGQGAEYHLGSKAQVSYILTFLTQTRDSSVRDGLFHEAKKAILRCRRAGLETGIWLVDDETYVVLSEILTLFDQQLATVPLYNFEVANKHLNKLFSANKIFHAAPLCSVRHRTR